MDPIEEQPEQLPSGTMLEILEGAQRAVLPQGVQLRPVYKKGISLTKVSEGWVPRRYNDSAGYCTVGYGHLLKKARCDGTGPEVEFLNGITEPRGEDLLVDDIEQAQITVILAVKRQLTEGQYAALCDFTFNVGGANFRNSTLLKVVNAGQFDRVPSQFERWTLAGGKEWPGLVTRRQREIEIFFDGQQVTRAVPQPGEDLSPVDVQKGEPTR
ncbi:lysozyme [Microvirga sp. 0TCS3.31]